MAITKSFIGPKKGRHPDEMPGTGLHFITWQAMQVRAPETAKSLEILKLSKGGARDLYNMKETSNIHQPKGSS
jgi:hypothetical protein